MTKELEALNYVWYHYYTEELDQDEVDEIEKNLNVVQDGLKRLEAIDNANPSEALECLEKIIDNLDDYADFEIKQEANEYIDTIKQALLKAQEPKHYLKWEDLEFGVSASLPATIKVKMGDTKYCLCLRTSFSDVKSVVLRDTDLKPILHIYEKEKQLFNDLHLERVE